MIIVTQFPAHFLPNYDQNHTFGTKRTNHPQLWPLFTSKYLQPLAWSAGHNGQIGIKGTGVAKSDKYN